MVSSITMRASFPSTMPATRKISKNSGQVCDHGTSPPLPIMGPTNDIAQIAIGIAKR